MIDLQRALSVVYQRRQHLLTIAGGIALYALAAGIAGVALKTVLGHVLAALGGAAFCAWSTRRYSTATLAPASASLATNVAVPAVTVRARDYRQAMERLDIATEFAGISIWDWHIGSQQLISDRHLATTPERPDGAFRDLDDFIAATVHPEDQARYREHYNDAMANGSNSLELSYRIVHADGEQRTAHGYSRIFRDSSGCVERILTVSVDTTRMTQAQRKLQEQSAALTRQGELERALLRRFNLATQVAGIGVWDWDIQADRYVADSAIARLFGLDMLDLTNARDFLVRVVHEADRAQFEAIIERALAFGNSLSHRYRIALPGGTVRHLQIHAHIERNAQGVATRALGVMLDMTAEVNRRQQLELQAHQERALRDRLNLATRTAGIGVWDMDLRTATFICDTQTHELLGHPGDIDPSVVANALHQEDRARIVSVVRKVWRNRTQEIVPLRHRIVLPDGTVRQVQTHLMTALDATGRPVKLLGVSRDVTADVLHANELQERSAHVQVLLERLSVACETAGISPWEVDLDSGRFVWAENHTPGLGLHDTPLDRYGETLLQNMHPSDAQDILALAAAVQDAPDGQTFSCRFRLVRSDGTTRHFQTYAHVKRTAGQVGARLLGATSDITNEVQTHELLQRQAAHERALIDRLSVATEAAGISSWEVDLESRRFLWLENPLHGVPSISIEGGGLTLNDFTQYMHPADRGSFAAALREAFRAQSDCIAFRYRSGDSDRPTQHIQCRARLMRDARGRVVRALGVSWDITKELQAAQQLQDAERRLERASLSSSEGHWEAEFLSARVWMSSSYHALLGYEESELPQTLDLFKKLIHPEDFEIGRQAMLRHIRDGAVPFIVDQRMLTKSGDYRWFRQRGMAERGADGRATRMSGSIQDIHQQKLAEDALNLAQRRFERAINGTQDGLWELEADGTAWISPRVGELLGYEPNELSSDTNLLRNFLHPDDANTVAKATQAHFQDAAPYDIEIRLHTKQREYRWFRARARAERDAAGRPLRLSGSIQDVTEARAAREQLVQATAAAEAANQAKSAFLANVSHEIRTPMNGIIGMTGLLLETALDRTQRDYADTIRASADSLLTVINDILDFSKIEAGKLDIEMIEVDLRRQVEDVGSLLAYQAAVKGLELVVHVEPAVPERVIGDPQRIRQCLINLIGNAIKFTAQGEIVVNVRAVQREDQHVLTRFEVRDTGIGIAADKLSQLFQPFVQADSSTTRHFGGTGLGLSIVRRLIEMMGGRAGVASTVGAGSTFWFELSLQSIESARTAPENLTRLGRRILVVDDNATSRAVLTAQLSEAGFDVVAAASGEDALARMRHAIETRRPFELVLADYGMPEMDGAALGQAIHADPALADTRVVILTLLDRGDVGRFAALGFAGYLTKPVRPSELFECIDHVLARDAQGWHIRTQPIVTRGVLRQQEITGSPCGTVLLVEDNPVNQKVAVRYLERMQWRVRVANHGLEGVEACRNERYDLVLMDLQMPVMDGLAATREIRNLERDGQRMPIIALTANAMTSQLERCMEAGMDGFLTKPLDIERLRETLERYRPARRESVETQAGVPVDLGRLHELTDHDAQFAHELAVTFMESGAEILAEIDAALVDTDLAALSRCGHKLKGASANVYAEGLRKLADRLESQAAALDLGQLRALARELQIEFARATEFLREQLPQPDAEAG